MIPTVQLTFEKNKMIEFYKQIEFTYNNKIENMIFVITTIVQLKQVGRESKRGTEKAQKKAQPKKPKKNNI